jgi:hypothetical protein
MPSVTVYAAYAGVSATGLLTDMLMGRPAAGGALGGQRQLPKHGLQARKTSGQHSQPCQSMVATPSSTWAWQPSSSSSSRRRQGEGPPWVQPGAPAPW